MEVLSSFFGKIDRVMSISLFSLSFVKDLSSVSIEDGPLSFCLSETSLESFSEAINVRGVNFCANLHVVLGEDEIFVVSWKDGGTIDLSNYLEVERVCRILESDSSKIDRIAKSR